MLGCVVVDKQDPLRKSAPNPDLAPKGEVYSPKDIVPNISDEAVPYKNLERIYEAAHNNDVKARLTKFFTARTGHQKEEDKTVKAFVVLRYKMLQPGTKLQRLLEDDRYKEEVKNLFTDTLGKGKEGSLPLVTEMMTCAEMSAEVDEKSERGVDLQIQAPAGEAAGVPDAIDPEVGFAHSDSRATKEKTKIKAEVIFALAYDEMIITRILKKKGMIPVLHKAVEDGEPEFALGDKISAAPGVAFDPYFSSEGPSETSSNDCDIATGEGSDRRKSSLEIVYDDPDAVYNTSEEKR